MRQHLSVIALLCRSVLYKLLALLLALAALEGCLFHLAARGLLPQAAPGHIVDVFAASRIHWAFALAFLLLTFFLCRTGTETSSKVGYTLRRLSLSENWVFFHQGLCNTVCYLILWAVQVLLVFALAGWYLSGQEAVGSQTLFLLFYRSNFLRGLLPLDSPFDFVCNGLLALAVGFAAARFPLAQRRGSRFGEVIPACGAAICLFGRSLTSGGKQVVIVLAAAIILGVTIYRVFAKEEVLDIYDEI